MPDRETDNGQRTMKPIAIPCFDGSIPCSGEEIPGSESNRESAATHWNCRANRRKPCRKGVQNGEFQDRGRSGRRGSLDAIGAEDHCGWKFTLSSSATWRGTSAVMK